MRYIGNKELLAPEIIKLLTDKGLCGKNLTFFDAFCGTGAVSNAVKGLFNLKLNDALNWCVTYTKGRIYSDKCKFKSLNLDPFDFFNSNQETTCGFFYNSYSNAVSQRMYFTPFNAGRIDYIRNKIEEWKRCDFIDEFEYCYLLACLIESVSAVSNTAGVYGAFLKHWDPRALKPLVFLTLQSNSEPAVILEDRTEKAEVIAEIVECDVIYLDPPYTQNQYGTQYHLLETLILNDNPPISEITGSRSTSPMRSDWSKDIKSHIAFDRLVAKTKAKHIILSYSKDGFMTKGFIEACLKRYGIPETYFCKEISYKKYTNFKSKRDDEHIEYLFYVEKGNEVIYESPLNYIGSKAKIVKDIKDNLPKNVTKFVDAFGGGFNVGINIDAELVVYNDINHFVYELIKSIKEVDTYQFISYVKRLERKFNLEPCNKQNYLRLRDYYNSLPLGSRNPKILFTLILYSFNQQIRFNGNHEFNNPVGMRWFNDKVLEKLISFSRAIKEKNIDFKSVDYRDLLPEIDPSAFIYLDPPYLLTNGSYNDGKRGFEGWDEKTEADFFLFVDKLNKLRTKFMVSYVIEHNGKFNFNLDRWLKLKKYFTKSIDSKFKNNRKEMIIKNFKS